MSEWVQVRLGDVAEINGEKVPRWPDDRPIRYIDIASVSHERGIDASELKRMAFADAPGRARRLVRKGDVLVSTVRPNLRAFAQVPEALDGEVASTGFATLRAAPEVVLPGFLWILVNTEDFVDEMVARCTGSNYPAIRADDVAAYQFMLPPLSEQARIVDLLSSVQSQVAALTAERDAARNLRSASLVKSLGDIPARPLGEVLRAIEAGRSPLTDGEVPRDDQRAVLKVSAVLPGKFVPTEAKALAPETPMRADWEVKPGDVLMTRANTPARVGAVCRVPEGIRQGLYLCDKTLRLVADQSQVLPGYLAYALDAPAVRAWLSSSATGTSASMFNISQAKIRAIPTAMPDLETQRRIAAQMHALDAVVDRLEAEVAALRGLGRELLKALMGQDFPLPQTCPVTVEGRS